MTTFNHNPETMNTAMHIASVSCEEVAIPEPDTTGWFEAFQLSLAANYL